MKTAPRHCHFLQDAACLPDGDVFSLVTFAGILCNLPPPTYLPPFHSPVVRPPTPFWRGKGNKRRRKRRRLKVLKNRVAVHRLGDRKRRERERRKKKKSHCCFDLICADFRRFGMQFNPRPPSHPSLLREK